jgi:ring-1,2-phenylacetyl-CoA epoxidase subunit PaaC
VELSNEASPDGKIEFAGHLDYATTITKLFLHAAFMLVKWPQLARSTDPTIAAVAQKAYKETQYHFEHAQHWLVRFGDGTTESAARAQNALNTVWRYTAEWFSDDATDRQAHEHGLSPLNESLQQPWLVIVDSTLQEAMLKRPANQNFMSNGKNGEHTEALSYLLGEMQTLARQHPGATW